VIIILDGKGGRQRVVPMGPLVVGELQAAGMPHRGPAFPRRDGKPGPNTAARISQAANRYLRSVGITVP